MVISQRNFHHSSPWFNPEAIPVLASLKTLLENDKRTLCKVAVSWNGGCWSRIVHGAYYLDMTTAGTLVTETHLYPFPCLLVILILPVVVKGMSESDFPDARQSIPFTLRQIFGRRHLQFHSRNSYVCRDRFRKTVWSRTPGPINTAGSINTRFQLRLAQLSGCAAWENDMLQIWDLQMAT